jgi:signal transduction histidine kinase
MKYSQKIFLAVFLSTIIISGIILWVAYYYSSQQLKDDFIKKYSVFSQVLGDTLTQLDERTETLMYNTAKLVAERDDLKGTLSTKELKELRDELKVTHLFVVDKGGKFIRSTNEAPELIPNAFSFCSKYEQMITGEKQFDATPIIHPEPEPLPYKFLFVPNTERTRLVEVGIRVDFIAQTLTKALNKDESINSLSLYSPKGKSFGTFTSSKVDFKRKDMQLPDSFPSIREFHDRIEIFSKVRASRTQCCQCDKSKTSINGEYYYVLKSEVSKGRLAGLIKKSSYFYLAVALGLLVFSYLFSRILSKRLVRSLELAAQKAREIQKSRNLSERLGISGTDEVSFLAQEFDSTLGVLESTQKQLLERERESAKIDLVHEIIHDIKSPLNVLGMYLKTMDLSQQSKKIITSAHTEIRQLMNKLKTTERDSFSRQDNEGLHDVCAIVDLVVKKKKLELSEYGVVSFTFHRPESQVTANFNEYELHRILSNIINNSHDSLLAKGGGTIEFSISEDKYNVTLVIVDDGIGMVQEVQNCLFKTNYSSKGSQGMALLRASKMIKSWGGDIYVRSKPNIETKVFITLRKGVKVHNEIQENIEDIGVNS